MRIDNTDILLTTLTTLITKEEMECIKEMASNRSLNLLYLNHKFHVVREWSQLFIKYDKVILKRIKDPG